MRRFVGNLLAVAVGLLSYETAKGQATVIDQGQSQSVSWDFGNGNLTLSDRAARELTFEFCPGNTTTLRTEGAGSAYSQVGASGSGGVIICNASIGLLQADVVSACFFGLVTVECGGEAVAGGTFTLELDRPCQVSYSRVRNGMPIESAVGFHKANTRLSFAAAASAAVQWPEDIFAPLVSYSSSMSEVLTASVVPTDLKEAVLRGIEVTQSVQDWNNSVPLVQGKPTFVRVALEAKGLKDRDRVVQAYLRGYRGIHQLPKSPLQPLRGFAPNPTGRAKLTEDAVYDRIKGVGERRLITFRLPPEWTTGELVLQLEVKDAELETQEVAGPPGNQANDGEVIVNFTPVEKPSLLLVPMRVRTPNGIMGPPSRRLVLKTLAAATARLPVSGFKPFSGTKSLWGEPVLISGATNTDQFIHKLYAKVKGDSVPTNALVLGVLDYEVLNNLSGNAAGIANEVGGRVAWTSIRSLADLEASAATATHELSHLLGRPHSTDESLGRFTSGGRNYFTGHCGETNYSNLNFPYFFNFDTVGTRASLGPIGEENSMVYGCEIVSRGGRGRVEMHSPYERFDLMGYCRPRWPSAHTYSNVFVHVTNRFRPASPGSPGPGGQGDTAQTPIPGVRVLVRGAVDFTTGQVNWLPFYCYTKPDPDVPPPGNYELRVFSGSGGLLESVSFALEVPEDGTPESVPLLIEVQADTDMRRVELWHAGVLMGSRVGSLNPPAVTVISPNGGESFSNAPVSIEWEAGDADGDELSYIVQYSPDNGTTWSTLAVDWPATNLVVESSELKGASNAFIRVLATDGFYCSSDEGAGGFVVVGGGPEVAVIAPQDGDMYYGDSPVSFEALAIDQEDGELNSAAIVWRSDRDGLLGTGQLYLNASQLSPGEHIITATVTDGAGNTNAESITIQVQPLVPPSLEALGREPDGSVRLEVASELGTAVFVESSSNLADWLPYTNLSFAGVFSHLLTVPAAEPAKFFRARVVTLPPDAPAFVLEPRSVTISNSSTFLLSCAATGAVPISYQWYFDGAPLAGETNAMLLFMDAGPFDSGRYYLVASNSAGLGTSMVAAVSITNGTDYQVIHRFGTNLLDGVSGFGALALDAQGWLYGCTFGGGVSNAGVIYRIHTNGQNFSVLRRLDASTEGSTPMGGLILARDGRLYGTCSTGGTNNSGTIFALNRDGSGFGVVKHFLSFGDCRNPQGELLEGSDGRLYGTAYNGGGFGRGGVFGINKDGTGYQIVYGFRTTGNDGQGPLGGLMEALDGMLYGVTEFGGQSNKGTIFRIAKAGTNYLRIKDLGIVTGGAAFPQCTLLQMPDAWLYGTTYGGGAQNAGTVFKVETNGANITILKSFAPTGGDAQEPRVGLTAAHDGQMLGATRVGGEFNNGALFKISTNTPPSYSVVRDFFGGGDAARPRGALLRGQANVYYGTTFGGGASDRGTIFRIIPP